VKVFVVMPLSDYYLNQLYSVIRSVVDETDNNLVARHADERFGPGIIIKDIEGDIIESKIVVAAITERNLNVYYEVGYAHALRKPTILLVQTGTTLPFDMSAYRCIFYENSVGGRRTIEERLRAHIKAILGKERDVD
jgi:nucleoside 2-deoxyribosyltransferase